MDEQENDPGMGGGGRASRSRRPRPVSSTMSTGRERDFTGNNGGMINGGDPGGAPGAGALSADVSGVAAAASNAQEETNELLRKLRNLWYKKKPLWDVMIKIDKIYLLIIVWNN